MSVGPFGDSRAFEQLPTDTRHDKTCQVWTVERVSGGEEAGEGIVKM